MNSLILTPTYFIFIVHFLTSYRPPAAQDPMNNTPTKAYALVQKDVFEEQMSDGGVYREQKAPMVPLFGRLRDTVCTLMYITHCCLLVPAFNWM